MGSGRLEERLRAASPVATGLDRVCEALGMRSLFGDTAPIPFGRYLVAERLGAGGMGVVFRAHDPTLGRDVALKLLRERAVGTSAVDALRREARALAGLDHPCVLGVYEAGEAEGTAFIALQLASKGTLAEWLEETPRSVAEIVERIVEAGEGLAAAHRSGLIHRDVKPSNVFLSGAGRAMIGDFGVVSHHGHADDEPRAVEVGAWLATRDAGTLVGTPAYMAPEQRQSARVDHRCDQYALCLTAADALWGPRPPGVEMPAFAWTSRSGERIPARLAAALRRGLRAEPEARYPDIAELLVALRLAVRPWRRRPFVWVAGGLVGLSAAAAAGGTLAPSPAAMHSFRFCVRQTIVGIDAEDAVVNGAVRPGMVPFRDPGSPRRADDFGFDDDHRWLARGRRFAVVDRETGQPISDGHLGGARGCTQFSHSATAFDAELRVYPEAVVADGHYVVRTGSRWQAQGEPSRTPMHFDVRSGTDTVDLPVSAAGTALTILAYVLEARLPRHPEAAERAPQRVLLDVGEPSECADERACTSLRRSDDGHDVAVLHISSDDASRRYLSTGLLGRALVEIEAGQPWNVDRSASVGRTGDDTPYVPERPWAAARLGWSMYFSAAVWNNMDHQTVAVADPTRACAPWRSPVSIEGCGSTLELGPGPAGFGERWHPNLLVAPIEGSLCAYWRATTGECPRTVPADGGEVRCESVTTSSTGWDWYQHFVAVGRTRPEAVHDSVALVARGLRHRGDASDARAALERGLSPELAKLWRTSANARELPYSCVAL